ncbi:MAG: FAD-dependent oxidoreductase [Pseudomonadota bacterium]
MMRSKPSHDPASRPISRRTLLERAGAVGGSAAVYQLALALGLTPGRAAGAPVPVQPLAGAAKHVVLLGGGLSSLMSAYELEKAGYRCTILEASHRIGGRNLTLRSGDLVDEMGNPQTCTFDDAPHLYFNAGPARIPAHHHYLVHYCRELGVALEPFTNVNYNAWVHDTEAFSGQAVRLRRFMADARGFMSELTTKAMNADVFDADVSADDLERVIAFINRYGDLDRDGVYRGSRRAGYQQPGIGAPTAGMLEPGVKETPLEFQQILKSSFWRFKMHFGEGEDQAAPLMQPVGGMDRIVDGFVERISSPMLTHAQVKRITVGEKDVAVVYQHQGEHHELKADYCFNCIPKHLLLGLETNFPRRYREALSAIGRGKLYKIGIQMSERFWEDENIYGGISWTNQPVEQLWYPSHGAHSNKGVVLGAYTFNPRNAEMFARLSLEDRFEAALAQGEQLHPNYRKYAESFVSIPWHRMNHHMGCTARWTPEAREQHFKYLQQPLAERHFFMGDQLSYHPGWQEGAFSSAHNALNELQLRVNAEQANA